jgi:hypothetical protein
MRAMNTAAALLPRLFSFNSRRAARDASTSLDTVAPAPAHRDAVDARHDAHLTRAVAAGTLRARWN